MNIVTCKQCIFWSKTSSDYFGHRRCESPKLDSPDADGFGVNEGEPYNSGVIATGPDFGCIHGLTDRPIE